MVTAASSATIAKELITLTNKQFQGDSEVCPICCEPWDEQDRRFFPCHCGYQVCMFCWKKIKEEANGRCPACREIYTEEPQFKTPAETEGVNSADNSENNSPEDASSINGDSSAVGERASGVNQGNGQRRNNANSSVQRTVAPADRAKLRGVRVLQKNLVYVVGLPMSIARESTLRKQEYFGQYGKIKKIVVNRKIGESTGRPDSACAYITFTCQEDAECAIRALDGFPYNGRVIKAMYGTTKYCHQFLQGRQCHNPECLYLHHVDEVAPSFTKEEMQAGKNFQQIAHPGIPEGAKVIEKESPPAAVFPSPIKIVDYGSGGNTHDHNLDDRQTTNAVLKQRSDNFRQQQSHARFEIPNKQDPVVSPNAASPNGAATGQSSDVDGETVVGEGELLQKRSRLTGLSLSGNCSEDFSPLTAPLGNLSFSLPLALTTRPPSAAQIDLSNPVQMGTQILQENLSSQLPESNVHRNTKVPVAELPMKDSQGLNVETDNPSKLGRAPETSYSLPFDGRKMSNPATEGGEGNLNNQGGAWHRPYTQENPKLPQDSAGAMDMSARMQGMTLVNGGTAAQQQPNAFSVPNYPGSYGVYPQQPNSGNPAYGGSFNRM